jgi:mono/diheme cytochrome c family protein
MDWSNELNEWRNALSAWRRPWTLRKLTVIAVAAAVVGLAVFWIVTIPASVPASALAPYTPNIENGKIMFEAGDCSSCHANPVGDRDKVDRTRLPGGLALTTPFGTLYTPNISPDPKDGIGSWTEANFVTALWDGTSPGGKHYYPALPYTSYQRMKLEDVRDLFAYIKTLPPVAGKARAHAMMFPFSIRRTLGGWKFLYLDGKRFEPDPAKSAEWNRGAYLVNGPGHCAECHSPRNFMMAIISSERFAGGPNPEPDKDWVPNITQKGLSHGPDEGKPWSKADLEAMLADGSTPDGDYVGSQMADVVRNTSLLSKADRSAIATYILSLPPIDGPPRPQKKKK